jgi:Protein of unknown function (DUF3562)
MRTRISQIFITGIHIDFPHHRVARALAAVQDKNLCGAGHSIDQFNWHRSQSHPLMKLLSCARSRQPRRSIPLAPESSMSQPEPNVDEVVRSIAEETDTPTETVSKMYADTLADYRHEARVFDYVPLFAAKKVRDKLRNTSKHKH